MKAFFRFWKQYKFRIVVAISLLIILLGFIINESNSGTWSLTYSFDFNHQKPKFPKQSRGELECRRVLEKLFERPFPSLRPDFLKNDVTGKNLEIDCCNLDLRLGVEYNGRQHYNFVKAMHKNQDAFHSQQYRDKIKIQLCKENDFTLIIVPYTIKEETIENYLIEELRYNGFDVA